MSGDLREQFQSLPNLLTNFQGTLFKMLKSFPTSLTNNSVMFDFHQTFSGDDKYEDFVVDHIVQQYRV